MKRILCFALIVWLAEYSSFLQAKVVTLTVDKTQLTNQVSIATNEVAEIKSTYDATAGGGSPGQAYVLVQKDNRNFRLSGDSFSPVYNIYRGKIIIAGPATITLKYDGPNDNALAFCTVEITPESFPPGLTVILPDGTIGTVHVESSTNLIQWQDEWVQTFSNTNQNRFFRIRAERSLP